MLSLQSATAERWLEQVLSNLDLLLIDHAHCEKKAAGVAMNLLFAYVENSELTRAMSEIVQEELSHFHMVTDILEQRNIRFRRISPSSYGGKLHQLVDKFEPMRAVDRLLIAGLIEARSCERFGLLQQHLDDPELAEFYGSLLKSEARHHSTYIRLAKLFAAEDKVERRLAELASREAQVIAEGDDCPRMHS